MRQASRGWQLRGRRRPPAHPYNALMGLDAATIHVSRDQNHLVWDPAIPAVGASAPGSRRARLPGRLLRAVERRVHQRDARQAGLRPGRPGHRAGGRRRRGAGRHAPDRPARLRARGLGLDRIPSRGSACWPTTSPIPSKVTRLEAGADRVEFLARHPHTGGAVLRRDRRGAHCRDRCSTIPPDVHGGNMDTRHLARGVDAVPAGLPIGCAPVRRRRPCRPRATVRCRARPSKRRCGLACVSPCARTCTSTLPRSSRRRIRTRRLRNGARYATDGIGPDLLIAARDAIRRMIEWLGREHGLEPLPGLPAVQRGGRPAHQRNRGRAELHRHGVLPAGDLRVAAYDGPARRPAHRSARVAQSLGIGRDGASPP